MVSLCSAHNSVSQQAHTHTQFGSGKCGIHIDHASIPPEVWRTGLREDQGDLTKREIARQWRVPLIDYMVEHGLTFIMHHLKEEEEEESA